jgi:hypothetical protein
VHDFYKKNVKNDPNFVTWAPYLVEGDGRINEIYTELEYQSCTDRDFAEFYPVSSKYQNTVEAMKVKRVLNCLTGYDLQGNKIDFDLFGVNEL